MSQHEIRHRQDVSKLKPRTRRLEENIRDEYQPQESNEAFDRWAGTQERLCLLLSYKAKTEAKQHQSQNCRQQGLQSDQSWSSWRIQGQRQIDAESRQGVDKGAAAQFEDVEEISQSIEFCWDEITIEKALNAARHADEELLRLCRLPGN